MQVNTHLDYIKPKFYFWGIKQFLNSCTSLSWHWILLLIFPRHMVSLSLPLSPSCALETWLLKLQGECMKVWGPRWHLGTPDNTHTSGTWVLQLPSSPFLSPIWVTRGLGSPCPLSPVWIVLWQETSVAGSGSCWLWYWLFYNQSCSQVIRLG